MYIKMNKGSMRKRLTTRRKKNTLKRSRKLNASRRLKKNTLKRSRKLNASRRLKKRTSKKQSGGAWFMYQGDEITPGNYNIESLKKNKVSTTFVPDRYVAKNKIWRGEYGNWENFLKKNEQKYNEYESKISSKPVPLEGESLTQWAYLKNMDKVAEVLPFYSGIEKPYLNRIVFHKYYGEGKVIDYEGGINGQGWFIQFISPAFGGDDISNVNKNFVEAEIADNSETGGVPNPKYIYTFMFSKLGLSGGNILVKREIQDTIGVSIANYLKLNKGNPELNKDNPALGEILVNNISEHPPSFDKMIRILNIDEAMFDLNKEIYSSNTTMRIVIDLGNKLLYLYESIRNQNYAYSEDVTKNKYPYLAKYLIFTKKLKELKESGQYAQYIRIYSETYFPGKSSDTKIKGGGFHTKLMIVLGLLTLLLAVAAYVGGGQVAAVLTFAIAKTHISAGASKAILAAIPKILSWAKSWITVYGAYTGIWMSRGAWARKDDDKIKERYKRFVETGPTYLAHKIFKGREVVRSMLYKISNDVIRAARGVNLNKLTDEWFAERARWYLSTREWEQLLATQHSTSPFQRI